MSKWIPVIYVGVGLSIILLSWALKKKKADRTKLKMNVKNVSDDNKPKRINQKGILINV